MSDLPIVVIAVTWMLCGVVPSLIVARYSPNFNLARKDLIGCALTGGIIGVLVIMLGIRDMLDTDWWKEEVFKK